MNLDNMEIKKNSQELQGFKNNSLPNAIEQDVKHNWTNLHEAAAVGDDNKCQALLEKNINGLKKEYSSGNTPLHEAAWRGYSRCCKVLSSSINKKLTAKNKKIPDTFNIKNNFLDVQNNGGLTALHLAAQNGHNQCCRELLLAGADPDIKNNYGDTPLHTACRYGHAGATRVILSADCDPNKVNLNGDSALHVSCAMGRRKLTRLLLEADCDLNVKNGQGESPYDIAVRKKYFEILEILKHPQRMRKRKEKKNKEFYTNFVPVSKNLTWSPYGCHYFPDPRSFPSPKLETLPREPLRKGEKYYLDLGGHIRKGPIGIGNICYCGPFFKNIENKINCNRKSLRRYVHKTKECLDNKVQELTIRTNDKIELLARSVIADRLHCENRRVQLNRLLKPVNFQRQRQQINNSLKRSFSEEFVEKYASENGLKNALSYSCLSTDNRFIVGNTNDEVDVHALNFNFARGYEGLKNQYKVDRNEIFFTSFDKNLTKLLDQEKTSEMANSESFEHLKQKKRIIKKNSIDNNIEAINFETEASENKQFSYKNESRDLIKGSIQRRKNEVRQLYQPSSFKSFKKSEKNGELKMLKQTFDSNEKKNIPPKFVECLQGNFKKDICLLDKNKNFLNVNNFQCKNYEYEGPNRKEYENSSEEEIFPIDEKFKHILDNLPFSEPGTRADFENSSVYTIVSDKKTKINDAVFLPMCCNDNGFNENQCKFQKDPNPYGPVQIPHSSTKKYLRGLSTENARTSPTNFFNEKSTDFSESVVSSIPLLFNATTISQLTETITENSRDFTKAINNYCLQNRQPYCQYQNGACSQNVNDRTTESSWPSNFLYLNSFQTNENFVTKYQSGTQYPNNIKSPLKRNFSTNGIGNISSLV